MIYSESTRKMINLTLERKICVLMFLINSEINDHDLNRSEKKRQYDMLYRSRVSLTQTLGYVSLSAAIDAYYNICLDGKYDTMPIWFESQLDMLNWNTILNDCDIKLFSINGMEYVELDLNADEGYNIRLINYVRKIVNINARELK